MITLLHWKQKAWDEIKNSCLRSSLWNRQNVYSMEKLIGHDNFYLKSEMIPDDPIDKNKWFMLHISDNVALNRWSARHPNWLATAALIQSVALTKIFNFLSCSEKWELVLQKHKKKRNGVKQKGMLPLFIETKRGYLIPSKHGNLWGFGSSLLLTWHGSH